MKFLPFLTKTLYLTLFLVGHSLLPIQAKNLLAASNNCVCAATNLTDCEILIDFYNGLDAAVQADLGWNLDCEDMNNWTGIYAVDGNVLDINLANKNIVSDIPIFFGCLDNLQRLFLGGNDLYGEIPCELGNLDHLTDLVLSGNDLTGNIPATIGQLSNLRSLFLCGNQLSGAIPSELGNLGNLEVLSLCFNDLSGTLPEELSNLNNLLQIALNHNRLEGCFPISYRNFCDIDYSFNANPDLDNGGDFDAFCNNLEGGCPVIFTVEDACENMGNTIQIPITTEGFTLINDFQFTVHIDPEFATITNVNGLVIDDWTNSTYVLNSNEGLITIAATTSQPNETTLPDQTLLFSIEAQVVGDEGGAYSGKILEPDLAVTQDEVSVIPTLIDGNFCVLSNFNITGKIYSSFGEPMPEVLVETDYEGVSSSTREAGDYALLDIPEGITMRVTPSLERAVVKEKITDEDALVIKKHLLGETPITDPYQLIAAKVSSEPKLGVSDVINIKKMARDELSAFPSQTSWVFIPRDYQFTNPSNPFSYPTSKIYENLDMDYAEQAYVGVEIGNVVEGSNLSTSSDELRRNKGEAVKYAENTEEYLFSVQNSADMTLSIESQQVVAGEIISVPVHVSASEAIDLVAFEFTIQWDEHVLSFEGVNGFGFEALNENHFGTPLTTNINNKLKVIWENYPTLFNCNTSQPLFTIQLRVNENFSSENSTLIEFCEDCNNTFYNSVLEAQNLVVQNGEINGSPLSFEVIHFTAQLNQHQQVILEWTTTEEAENNHFEIERSPNGKDWATIEVVQMTEQTTLLQQYKAIDQQPLWGKGYYRLKQIDNNGEYTYSTVQMVELKVLENVVLLQNPIQEKLSIQCNFPKEQLLKLQLFNVEGQLVKEQNLMVQEKMQTLNWNVKDLIAGIYFLKILGDQAVTFKIIKE